MQTRRQVLQHAIVPLFGIGVGSRTLERPSFEIVSENTLLSRESARGFSMLGVPHCNLVVLCGAGKKAISAAPDLLRRARQGTWVIWEIDAHSPDARDADEMRWRLLDVFGVGISAPFRPGLYIEYAWPQRLVTRSFLEAARVTCLPGQIVATAEGTPVAVRRRIGRGGIIVLGAMLGPNLYAEEPQAHAIAKSFLGV